MEETQNVVSGVLTSLNDKQGETNYNGKSEASFHLSTRKNDVSFNSSRVPNEKDVGKQTHWKPEPFSKQISKQKLKRNQNSHLKKRRDFEGRG